MRHIITWRNTTKKGKICNGGQIFIITSRPMLYSYEYLKCVCFIGVFFGLGCFGGCEAVLVRKRPRDCGLQIAGTKGLISVDRRTSLLSYLQYPVPYQSRLQRIYRSQCPKGDWMWCWAEAYRYAWTQRAVSIVAFQHRFWLRGVQSLSCRW